MMQGPCHGYNLRATTRPELSNQSSRSVKVFGGPSNCGSFRCGGLISVDGCVDLFVASWGHATSGCNLVSTA